MDGARHQEGSKKKVATMVVGVGYPDHWRDYSGSTFGPTMRSATSSVRSRCSTASNSRRSASRWTATNGG